MRVKCFHLGAYGTNCFLAYDENNIAYFFDCGGKNLKQVYEYIEEHKLNLQIYKVNESYCKFYNDSHFLFNLYILFQLIF